MSSFRAYNLNHAWNILYDYIEEKRSFAPKLQHKYPEAFETWQLITQLYDAYKVRTVHSELHKQIAEILSRAPMPLVFANQYNDEGYSILLQDLLVYINKELEMSLQTGMTATVHRGILAKESRLRSLLVQLKELCF